MNNPMKERLEKVIANLEYDVNVEINRNDNEKSILVKLDKEFCSSLATAILDSLEVELPKKVPILHYRGCECNKCWVACGKNDTIDEITKSLKEQGFKVVE